MALAFSIALGDEILADMKEVPKSQSIGKPHFCTCPTPMCPLSMGSTYLCRVGFGERL